MYWKAAERLYKNNPKQYNSIEEAKKALDEPIRKYVKVQESTDLLYIQKISKNAQYSWENKSINELVADLMVLAEDYEDQTLYKMVRDMINNDGYTPKTTD